MLDIKFYGLTSTPASTIICEEFLMPLHQLIFLEESNCTFETAMEIICEYRDYYFSKEEFYLRMYGGNIASSLLPRYAKDYIVHKEEVRQIFIDGFRNFLSDMKKAVFPPFPFYIGSYKFAKVKSTPKYF